MRTEHNFAVGLPFTCTMSNAWTIQLKKTFVFDSISHDSFLSRNFQSEQSYTKTV